MRNLRLLLRVLLILLSFSLVAGCGDDEGSSNTDDLLVAVADQTIGDPTMVSVDRVTAGEAGWVSIRALVGGTPADVLGFAPVVAGENMAIPVTLSRPARDGENLVATLHLDTGERGVFEFPDLDPAVVNSDDEEVSATFSVTVAALDQPSIIADPQVADPANEVTVRGAVSPNGPALVSIQEDANGVPGVVLGSASIPTGASNNITVELNRNAVDGETLWAVLRDDQSPIGTLGPEDPELTDSAGNRIASMFEVAVPSDTDPAVTVADQEVNPINEVVVAEVASAGPGWMVIHEDDAGGVGGIVGLAHVDDGVTADVVVTLDRDTVDGETLYAMLHEDGGALNDYNGDDDPPARDGNGDIIAPAFVVSHPGNVMPAVTTADQAPNPLDTVFVADVSSAGPGFIVIHDDNGGAPDATLGSALLSLGTRSNVEITLRRNVADGETLWAVLYSDDDMDGMFDAMNDNVVNDGGPIQDSFVVTAITPALTVNDQDPMPATDITVASATSPGAGWVAVYADAAGSPGMRLGETQLTSGANSGVTVTLSRAAVPGETLHATVHVDRGTAGTFDDMEDVAAVDGGNPVTSTFTIMGGMAGPSVVISDQTATLTRLVTADSANLAGRGWVVIHDDNGGMPGSTILGQTNISAGMSTNIVVELSAPLADGAVVHAMLHDDLGTMGTWEPGTDTPTMDMGSTVTDSATIAVPAGTADVRITADNNGSTSYNFRAQLPADAGVIGMETENQTLTFAIGTRYEIDVLNFGSHPLSLRDNMDADLLAQGGVTGSLEGDGGINFVDSGSNTITFTATASLAAALDDYICQNHSGMTGVATAQ